MTRAAAMSRGDESRPASDAAIRQASAADLPAIRELTRDAYARYLDRMDVVPAPVRNDYEAEAAAGQIWVLNLDGPEAETSAPALAGVIVLIEAGDSVLIENVAVSPAAQGTGLGRRLMEFAEDEARARGFSRMTLYTNEVMTENLAIYARLGYRETSRAQEDGYRRVFMEKRLDGLARA
jgi:GNAT superfamily N-acetyltransferase